MTIVEAARGITGGVDTHLDVHVAAALDPLGGLLGSYSFSRYRRGGPGAPTLTLLGAGPEAAGGTLDQKELVPSPRAIGCCSDSAARFNPSLRIYGLGSKTACSSVTHVSRGPSQSM